MDTENALTNAKESPNEIFLKKKPVYGQRCMACNPISRTLSIFNVCWRV